MGKKGFSFIELLTVIAIIPVLALLSFKYFGDQRKKSYKTIAQSSMTELMSLMKVAQKNDGHYHQFIYQMGYRPKGSLIANIGVKAVNSNPCDTSSPKKYPLLGTTGCSKNTLTSSDITIAKNQRCPYGTRNKTPGDFKGGYCDQTQCDCTTEATHESYTYYNCGNSSLDKATDVHTICNDAAYSYECSFKKTTVAITSSTNFGSCDSKAVCDHDEISLGAISGSFSEKMVLSHIGSFCID